jgi:hypothetical protein
MWEAVYRHFMYPTVYKRDPEKKPGVTTRYLLALPPLWLTTIAAVMWEGVLQGLAWDTAKLAVRIALAKLLNKGLLPRPELPQSKERMVRVGWNQYSSSGRKQYEMFLTIKKTVHNLPERHALAYARAKDDRQFGRIVRGEDEPVPVATSKRGKKTSPRTSKAADRKGPAKR